MAGIEMGMDPETIGEIVSGILEKGHVQMLIDIPAGKLDPVIKDNTNLGPAVQFYIVLSAMSTVLQSFSGYFDRDGLESFVDGCLDMVKQDVLAAAAEE